MKIHDKKKTISGNKTFFLIVDANKFITQPSYSFIL